MLIDAIIPPNDVQWLQYAHPNQQCRNMMPYSQDAQNKPVTERLDELPILFDDLNLSALPNAQQQLIALIDANLPQTQCGLCGHPEGCLPYAHAIVIQQEAHNKCVPGGQVVSDQIFRIIENSQVEKSQIDSNQIENTQFAPAETNPITQPSKQSTVNSLAVVPSKWTTNPNTGRPIEVRAIINEEDCIGCTKCIPACPVDAIIGTGKHMHSILTDLCTGCELCLPPCPVDCIELVPLKRTLTETERQSEQEHLRQRYHHHLDRAFAAVQDKRSNKPVVSMVESKLNNIASARANQTNMNNGVDNAELNAQQAQKTIANAKLRSKIKKLEKQLSVRDNANKRAELLRLQAQL